MSIFDPDWILHPGLFTPEQCDRFTADARMIQEMAGDMSWKNAPIPEIRSSRLRWCYRNQPQFAWAFEIVDRSLDDAAKFFGVKITPFDSFQHTLYTAKRRGQYDWHRDDFPEKKLAIDRVLSICIQLSEPDSYAGGHLELRVPNPPPAEILARRGAAIVFRSDTYHRVSPTLAGNRYSAVAWAEGQKVLPP